MMPATKSKAPPIVPRFLGIVILAVTLCLVVQPYVRRLRQDSAWSVTVIGGCIFGLGVFAHNRFKSCWWKKDLAVAIGCLGPVLSSMAENKHDAILGLVATGAIGSVVALTASLLAPAPKSPAT